MDISSKSAIVHSNQEGIEKAKTNNMTVQDKPTDEVQSESVIDTQHMAVSADGDTVISVLKRQPCLLSRRAKNQLQLLLNPHRLRQQVHP